MTDKAAADFVWSRCADQVAHGFKWETRYGESYCGVQRSVYNTFDTPEETGAPECYTCRQLILTDILLQEGPL